MQSNEKEYNAHRAKHKANYRGRKKMFKEKPRDKRMRLKLSREYMRDYRKKQSQVPTSKLDSDIKLLVEVELIDLDHNPSFQTSESGRIRQNR